MKASQPSLYLALVKNQWGKERTPEGIVYYMLEEGPEISGGKRVQEFKGQDWERLRPALFKNMNFFVDSIEQGEFMIHPDEKRGGSCTFCDYSSVCRKYHQPTRVRSLYSKFRQEFDQAHVVLDKKK